MVTPVTSNYDNEQCPIGIDARSHPTTVQHTRLMKRRITVGHGREEGAAVATAATATTWGED